MLALNLFPVWRNYLYELTLTIKLKEPQTSWSNWGIYLFDKLGHATLCGILWKRLLSAGYRFWVTDRREKAG